MLIELSLLPSYLFIYIVIFFYKQSRMKWEKAEDQKVSWLQTNPTTFELYKRDHKKECKIEVKTANKCKN